MRQPSSQGPPPHGPAHNTRGRRSNAAARLQDPSTNSFSQLQVDEDVHQHEPNHPSPDESLVDLQQNHQVPDIPLHQDSDVSYDSLHSPNSPPSVRPPTTPSSTNIADQIRAHNDILVDRLADRIDKGQDKLCRFLGQLLQQSNVRTDHTFSSTMPPYHSTHKNRMTDSTFHANLPTSSHFPKTTVHQHENNARTDMFSKSAEEDLDNYSTFSDTVPYCTWYLVLVLISVTLCLTF